MPKGHFRHRNFELHAFAARQPSQNLKLSFMVQSGRINLQSGRRANCAIYNVARSGFDYAVNFADICADHAKAQELDPSKESHRKNSRCPARDGAVREKSYPKYPAREYD